MTLTEEAQKQKPKRPMNAYFKFRNEKMNQLKGVEGRSNKAKQMWDEIDEKTKQKLQTEFRKELDQYKVDMEAWKKKFDVEPEDMKRKSKTRKVDTDDEEDRKPIKTKGTKEAKESKKDEKKKEEKKKSPEKERGKSKKDEPKVDNKKKGK